MTSKIICRLKNQFTDAVTGEIIFRMREKPTQESVEIKLKKDYPKWFRQINHVSWERLKR